MAFGEYKGRCIGRLMHFAYAYDMKSDEAIFQGADKEPMMTLKGKPYANYTWDGDTDVPTFVFLGDFDYLNQVQDHRKPDILRSEEFRKDVFGS